MPDKDPAHWLYRLSAEEWLRSAEHELERAHQALRAKQQRAGVVGTRRAAGMAWNAVLWLMLDERYGRSYMDHLVALAEDLEVPASVRAAARALREASLSSEVVQLGPGDTRLAEAAQAILEHARERVHPNARA